MKLRRSLVAVHRWLSVFALLFWVAQIATGIFSVFHWEIDDAIVAGPRRPTDFEAIERSVAGKPVVSIWTTAGKSDRYDVSLPDRVERIDGAGNVLRVRRDGERWIDGGFVDTLVTFHHDLLLEDTGRTIMGISGLLLLSNLFLGLSVAWPRRGEWGRAMRPRRTAYSWHRALGLWLVVPAIGVVTAGTMLAFDETLERWLHASFAAPTETSTAAKSVGMLRAIEVARSRFPDAVVSGIRFPTVDSGVWKLTLRRSGEWRRAYGKTIVYVSAVDGRILAASDALTTHTGQRVFESLFSFHAGEMFGAAGRIVVFATGITLLVSMLIGARMWIRRR